MFLSVLQAGEGSNELSRGGPKEAASAHLLDGAAESDQSPQLEQLLQRDNGDVYRPPGGVREVRVRDGVGDHREQQEGESLRVASKAHGSLEGRVGAGAHRSRRQPAGRSMSADGW